MNTVQTACDKCNTEAILINSEKIACPNIECANHKNQEALMASFKEVLVSPGYREELKNFVVAKCNECKADIKREPGRRFKCKECEDYDLCVDCIGFSTHDITHKFIDYHDPLTTKSVKFVDRPVPFGIARKCSTTIPDGFRVYIEVEPEWFNVVYKHIMFIYGSAVVVPGEKIIIRGQWQGNGRANSVNSADSIEFRYHLIPPGRAKELIDKMTFVCFWVNFSRKEYGRWAYCSKSYETDVVFITPEHYTQNGESVTPTGKLLEFIEAHDMC